MHFKRHYKAEIGYLDITPLIDVVFLLLIFFMLSSKLYLNEGQASFVVTSPIEVHLPHSKNKKTIEQKRLTIIIDKKGDIYLSVAAEAGNKETKVNFRELGRVLKSLSKGNSAVVIYADKQTALEKIIKIWDICKESKVKEIGISTLSP